MNLENAEGEKSRKGTSDRLCSVEDGKSAGEFASAVEPDGIISS